jgi:hypothetical protein
MAAAVSSGILAAADQEIVTSGLQADAAAYLDSAAHATTNNAESSGCRCSTGRHRDRSSIVTWLFVLFEMVAISRGKRWRL